MNYFSYTNTALWNLSHSTHHKKNTSTIKKAIEPLVKFINELHLSENGFVKKRIYIKRVEKNKLILHILLTNALSKKTEPYQEYELLLQLKAGSETAFTILFNNYRSNIFDVAFKMLRSTALAEEVVQDVFLKIWLKRHDMDAVRQFDAYLYVMARNSIFDQLKKKAYENAAQSFFESPELTVDDTEFLVRQHECQKILNDAIELLPAQQKQVYRLAKLQGFSHEEIAKMMQLSRLTVKKHMAMALQNIRKYLDAHLHLSPLMPFIAAGLFNSL